MTTQLPADLQPGTRGARAFAVQRATVNEDARTVELAFASETPYDRWWGREILDCTATSVRLARLADGAPLLVNHEADDQVGVVESVSIGADRVARAVVRFGRSARAEEIWRDVADGIRRKVSVGYMVHAATLVERGSDSEPDKPDTYRVTDWEPYEVSIVPIPADATVGVGRSAAPATVPAQPKAAAPQEPTMPETTIDLAAERNQAATEAAAAVRQANAQIIAIGQQFRAQGGEALAAKAIAEGKTVDAFRADLMEHLAARPTATNDIGMSEREVKSYSVLRAIRAMVDRDWSKAGLEREASEAVAKRAGISPQHGGFFLPTEVQRRDLTAGTPTAGGNLVATNLAASSFIELLRSRARIVPLGARMLTGLVGNVTIPKHTGAATAYWLANEATAITESQQTIGQVALSPRNVGAYTEVSRQLMMQATPSADALVMEDLAAVLALAIDQAAINGSGNSGQPTGIINTAGIGSVTGTSLAYAGIVEFQTDVAAGNALTEGCAYLTTPAVAGLLMQRARFSNTDTPLWTGSVLDGTVAGFRGTTSTQMPAANMLFGDFSQVVIGEWGLLEIAMNPYANFQAAITGIRAIQTVDIAIRQASAFSLATSIT